MQENESFTSDIVASFECCDCNLKFNSNLSFTNHINEIHNESFLESSKDVEKTAAQCPECAVTFTRKSNLTRHMRKFHNSPPEIKELSSTILNSQQCPECSVWFTRRSNLIRHIRRFHESLLPYQTSQKAKIFRCSQCETKFTKWRNCKRHMRNFHEAKQLLDCNFYAVESSPTNFPKQEHTTNFNFEISPSYGLPLTNFNELAKHKSDVQSTKRNVDGFTDGHPQEIDRSELTFLNVPYNMLTCLQCNRNFSKRSNLVRHVTRFHPQHLKFISNEKDTDCIDLKKCPLCDYSDKKLNLYVHFSNAHNVPIVIECFDFETLQQFEEWRLQVEKESQSRFIRVSLKLKSDFSRTIFACSQSHDKWAGFCPAEITLVAGPDKCTVYFIQCHVGHKDDDKKAAGDL